VPDGIEVIRLPWLRGPVSDWLTISGQLHQRLHDEGMEHEHRPIPVTVTEPMDPAWWRCPLGRCGHGALLHDGDGVDEDWICCSDGCSCRGSLDDATRRAEQRGR
jgi:hypothetical protein